jgi:hypothetical protein
VFTNNVWHSLYILQILDALLLPANMSSKAEADSAAFHQVLQIPWWFMIADSLVVHVFEDSLMVHEISGFPGFPSLQQGRGPLRRLPPGLISKDDEIEIYLVMKVTTRFLQCDTS